MYSVGSHSFTIRDKYAQIVDSNLSSMFELQDHKTDQTDSLE